MKRLALALALFILLAGCSSEPSASSETTTDKVENVISIEDYKQQVTELNDKILNASIPLGNMAQWELNFMKTLGRSSDDIVDRAFEWLETESDYTETGVKDTCTEIASLMKEISDNTDTSPESQMIDIFNQTVSLYESYVWLYETVTEAPTSVTAFAEDVSTYFPAIPTNSKTLTDMLTDE